jgi:DNA-binding beta-propeller fold protein YncE
MDMNNNRVEEFNSSGCLSERVRCLRVQGGRFLPAVPAVDGIGDIWVADEGNQRDVKFNNSGAFVLLLGGGRGNVARQFNNPWGTALDSNSNVWVTNTGNGRVEEFSNAYIFLANFLARRVRATRVPALASSLAIARLGSPSTRVGMFGWRTAITAGWRSSTRAAAISVISLSAATTRWLRSTAAAILGGEFWLCSAYL